MASDNCFMEHNFSSSSCRMGSYRRLFDVCCAERKSLKRQTFEEINKKENSNENYKKVQFYSILIE